MMEKKKKKIEREKLSSNWMFCLSEFMSHAAYYVLPMFALFVSKIP